MRKNSPRLKAELDAFSSAHSVGTLFGNIELQKYLQQTNWAREAMSPAELAKFSDLVRLFRRYGAQYDIDWLLMAAQDYQESQLDHSRRSGAGAIGVMQLTTATGAQMGVGDIRELEPNIHAGIKYVRYLLDTYDDEPRLDRLNRVLFAIAAYNAGPNRIRELRQESAARHSIPSCGSTTWSGWPPSTSAAKLCSTPATSTNTSSPTPWCRNLAAELSKPSSAH